jgi:uncharacterized caspase-like protein
MAKKFTNGHALIVGVGADLPCTIKDAEGLAEILKDEERCAYPPEQVHLLTEKNANRESVLMTLDKLAKSTNDESTIIIYFSGHGHQVMTTTGDSYYLMTHGYDMSHLYNTAISGAEFTEKLTAIPAKKILVLLDCCHAGGMAGIKGVELTKSPIPPEALKLLSEGSGYTFIASSKEDELSFTDNPYSVFTGALIEALCGQGIAKKDGYVRVADLALHTREVVPKRTKDKQHPILHYKQADNFVIAFYAAGETQAKKLPFQFETETVSELKSDSNTVFDQINQQIDGQQTNVHGDFIKQDNWTVQRDVVQPHGDVIITDKNSQKDK